MQGIEKTIKILHTIGGIWQDAGGPAESVPSLCGALAEGGQEVTLACWEGNLSEATKVCQEKGVRLKTYPVQWRHSIWYSRAMSVGVKELIKQSEIVHGQGVWIHLNWITGKWARRYDKGLMISPRGALMPNALNRSYLKKRLAWAIMDKRNLRRADCLHACSEKELQGLRRLGLTNPVAVIPNGVEVPQGIAERSCAKYNGTKKLLFLSRLHPSKGVFELIEAWARLAERLPEWRLIMAGADYHNTRARLEVVIKEKKLSDSVRLVGAVYGDEKWRLLREADLFVLPTKTENFGIAIGEALASGVAVVTSKEAPWRGIEENDCGWRVPLGVDYLKEALEEAMSTEHTKLKEMGQRGKVYISQNYSWGRVAEKMLETYKWMLGGGAAPVWVEGQKSTAKKIVCLQGCKNLVPTGE